MNVTMNLTSLISVTMDLNWTTTLSTPPKGPRQAYVIADKLWIYIAPILFVIAIVGNTVTFLVMKRPCFRNASTSVFLQCLAIADTAFVVVGLLPEWLEVAKIIHIKAQHEAICKIYKWMFYVTGDIAVWILVIFTMHRCYSVCRPLEERASGTINKIKWVILAIIVLSCLKSIPQFWARGNEYKIKDNGEFVLKKRCGYPSEFAKNYVFYIRPYIVLVLVSVLPLLIITVCNILIIKSLATRAKFSRNCSISNRMRKEDSARRQTTVMCLTVSCLFLVCMTPSLILLIGKPVWIGSDSYIIAKAVNNLLVYVNHSVNFIMYCLSANRFRQEFLNMIGAGTMCVNDKQSKRKTDSAKEVEECDGKHEVNHTSPLTQTTEEGSKEPPKEDQPLKS